MQNAKDFKFEIISKDNFFDLIPFAIFKIIPKAEKMYDINYTVKINLTNNNP